MSDETEEEIKDYKKFRERYYDPVIATLADELFEHAERELLNRIKNNYLCLDGKGGAFCVIDGKKIPNHNYKRGEG